MTKANLNALDQKHSAASLPDDRIDNVTTADVFPDASDLRPGLAPPSYSTVLAKDELAERQVHSGPTQDTAFVYTQWLNELQKNLRKYKKGPAKQLRERVDASDGSEVELIIAQEIARLIGANRDDPDDLSRYSLDSLTGIRIASWAQKVLGVELDPDDFYEGHIVTLSDAVALIASRL